MLMLLSLTSIELFALCMYRYVKSLMKDAYLTIREDAMGNIWGRWTGSDASEGMCTRNMHDLTKA